MYKYVAPAEDEMFAMASALAMTSPFPAPGDEGCTEEEAMMAIDLLLCLPLDGEVSLTDAAKVIDVSKGRLGSSLNRLVRRGIMLRRVASGETRLRMTGLGQSLACRLGKRSEALVDLTWKVNPELVCSLLELVFEKGTVSLKKLQEISDLPMPTVEKALEIFIELGALRRDIKGDISYEPAFRMASAFRLARAFPKKQEADEPEANFVNTDAPEIQKSLSGNDVTLLSWLDSPKSTSEVADHLGVSRQRAQKRLSGLEAAGYLQVSQPRPRHSKFYQAVAPTGADIKEERPMISPIAHSPGGPKALVVCDQCGTTASVRCKYEQKSTGNWKPDEGQALIRVKGLGWEMVKGKHYCPTCTEERRRAAKKAPETKVEAPALKLVPASDPPKVLPAVAQKEPPAKEDPPVIKEIRPVLSITETQNSAKEAPMAAPTPIQMAKPVMGRSPSEEPPREPTIAQNRLIRQLLDEVYDIDACRYKGEESDLTVSDTLKENGVLPGWVTRVRESFYGSGSGNEEEENLGLEIETLLEDITKRQTAVEDVVKKVVLDLKEIEKDRQKVKDLQTRFEKWKANLGPKGRAI